MKNEELKAWKIYNEEIINSTRFRKLHEEFGTAIYHDIIINQIKRKEYCDDCGCFVMCLCFNSLETAIDTIQEQHCICNRCMIVDGVFNGDLHLWDSFEDIVSKEKLIEIAIIYNEETEKVEVGSPLRNTLEHLSDVEINEVVSEYSNYFDDYFEEEWVGESCNVK